MHSLHFKCFQMRDELKMIVGEAIPDGQNQRTPIGAEISQLPNEGGIGVEELAYCRVVDRGHS
ncbi:Uncharacterised protein [Mycobacteroides abscessus subsp. abscessus]|nr:Uncharacterised protein [Mycobacteroides abscessus subsp. abscessus]